MSLLLLCAIWVIAINIIGKIIIIYNIMIENRIPNHEERAVNPVPPTKYQNVAPESVFMTSEGFDINDKTE